MGFLVFHMRWFPCRFLTLLCFCPPFIAAEVDFSRDVLPILSDRCFHCHGPDDSHREGELRLDVEQAAREVIDSGELMARVLSDDPDEQMPPPESHRKPLNADELSMLRGWVKEGAPWGKHWAFKKPRRSAVPAGGATPIDAFVRRRLTQEGLSPATRTAKHTQLRRLSFVLTGLPPSDGLLDRFTRETQPIAWTTVVEELLASSHHGERLAMWWLDAARYSDTDGYQADAERTNWPWRDWVVQAFNDNMPFDQFTIEQFAGDLLENPTPEQKLATCFHRNHMANGEGGRHPEESRIDYVIDRVNTTGTVWLGLTLGCTQCHAHKFDPIAHEDYYSIFAYFNNIDESGAAGGKAKPILKYISPLAKRAVSEMQATVAERTLMHTEAHSLAEQRFEKWLTKHRRTLDPEYQAWHGLTPSGVDAIEGSTLVIEADGTVQVAGANPIQDDYRIYAPPNLRRVTGWKLEVLPHVSHTRGGLSRGQSGEFILTNVKLQIHTKGQSQLQEVTMSGAKASVEKKSSGGRRYAKVEGTLDDDPRNGWTTEGHDPTQAKVAVFALVEPLVLAPNQELLFTLLQRSTLGDANIGRFRLSVTDELGETIEGVKASPLEELVKASEVDDALRKRLLTQFLEDEASYQQAKQAFNEAKRQLNMAKKSAGELAVQVLSDREETRQTHVLERGVWDAKGSKVQPGVLPAVLPWAPDKATNRLDLAHWLTSPDNPLTARVVVNHLWQMIFGAGLVRTPEDFGLQGEQPTHPQLMDWLAVELLESGWNLRHLLRLMVSSDTFRQGSAMTAAMLERDPDNRLLARALRYRLPAWMLRDAALAASGLLNAALGGPPVKPYQPEGVWQEIFMGRFTYKPSVGPAQYRRTLYAYWRRSSAPTFLFDSAQRRVCEVRTRRTNTPLQALTLLNDQTMLESSRVLAEKSQTRTEFLPWMAKRILGRSLLAKEVLVFQRAFDKAVAWYQEHPLDAKKLLTTGQQRAPEDAAEWPSISGAMVVASMLLNLDEAITHE